MTKTPKKSKREVPPQLIGVLADAIAIGATSFRIEPNPTHIMAIFSAGSRATEIDFEACSGREMMNYLAYQVTDTKRMTGRFALEYGGRIYDCRVRLDRKRNPQLADVTWT